DNNVVIIIPVLQNVTVISGQRAFLQCTFQGINAAHQLIWIRNNRGDIVAHNADLLSSDKRLSVYRSESEYQLYINNVNINDEGYYTCETNTNPTKKANI
ncbi:unnamed protein product, partial [Didymodactylos carnosus]